MVWIEMHSCSEPVGIMWLVSILKKYAVSSFVSEGSP